MAAKKQKETAATTDEPDIEQLVNNKRKQTQLEEQIRDLQMLDAGADDDSEDAAMLEPDSDDSDAEDIRRL